MLPYSRLHIELLYEQILIFFAPGFHKLHSETLVITTSMEHILQNISLAISVETVFSKGSEGKRIQSTYMYLLHFLKKRKTMNKHKIEISQIINNYFKQKFHLGG